MNQPVKASNVILAGFFGLLLVFVFFFASQSGKPLVIDTNLKDLSPQLTEDRALQHAVAKLSSAIENRFTLLVTGPEQSEVELAAQQITKNLSAVNGVTATVGNDLVTLEILEQLSAHRFGLLTHSQRTTIENHSQNELVETANENLYQLSGGVGILPIDKDPFGWFTEYLTEFSSVPRANENLKSFTAVHVRLTGGGLETTVQERLQKVLSHLESEIRSDYPETQLLRSGVIFFAAEAAREAKRDITTIGSISIIAIVGLLLMTFFSLRPLLLPFLSVSSGITFAFIVTYWLYGSIHILTIVFGASLIGIIIDYSLHYFYCHSDQASSNTHSGLLNAMKLSLVSSLIGYGALGFSELISLQKIAVFSCAGLVAAWITVLAAAPRLVGNKITINPRFLPPVVELLSRITDAIARWPKTLCTIISVVLLLQFVNGSIGNDNPRVFFNPSTELITQERTVAEHLSKVEPGRYFVVRGENEDQLFERLEALYQHIPNEALLSIASWLPSPKQQQLNYQLQGSLYEEDGAVTMFMQSIGLDADPLVKEYQRYQASNGSALDLFKDSAGTLPPLVVEHDKQLLAFVLITDVSLFEPNEINKWRVEGLDYIDIAAMSSNALKNQRETSIRFLLLAFVLVGITLFIRYRSWSNLLMLVVPGASIATTLLVIGIFGSGITLFHSMALFLVLGLGMDYVIFVSELQNEKHIVLQAVFLSAVTSLLSFGLLSTSTIPVVHAFGITVLIGNGLNLIGAMIYASRLQHKNN